MKRLQNKVAVVYSDGIIGGAVAKAFAKEGATIFLAGRTEKKMAVIAQEIQSLGGSAETCRLDLLNEKEVEAQMADVVQKAGLTPQLECYNDCSAAWTKYMERLHYLLN